MSASTVFFPVTSLRDRNYAQQFLMLRNTNLRTQTDLMQVVSRLMFPFKYCCFLNWSINRKSLLRYKKRIELEMWFYQRVGGMKIGAIS